MDDVLLPNTPDHRRDAHNMAMTIVNALDLMAAVYCDNPDHDCHGHGHIANEVTGFDMMSALTNITALITRLAPIVITTALFDGSMPDDVKSDMGVAGGVSVGPDGPVYVFD